MSAARRGVDNPGAWFARAAAILLVLLFLVLPLAEVYSEALRDGLAAVWQALIDPDAISALKLTLMIAAITVPINTIGGLAAAWCIGRFDFAGRSMLTTLIELPLSVSPVISGLVWVLLFGAQGWLGPFLAAHGIQIVFAFPGLVLATLFVTFPLVARQLLPVLQEVGLDEEEAAITLGASGFGVWWNVTLPNLRWALLQGVLLCNARAMGEFGAVSVVSGHIPGITNTMPLQIEALFNGFQAQAAFSVAALLSLLALLTLGARALVEWRSARPVEAPEAAAAPGLMVAPVKV
jgi:sulfate transport system permease protein